MKPFVSSSLFIVVGLITALLIGFRSDLMPGHQYYDEEQEGLQDRIIIKFSHVVAENTPKGLAAEKFASLVKEKTRGKVEVQVFPNGILYSDDNEFNALKSGKIQMIAPAFSKLSNIIPAWSVMDLPFAFSTQEQVEQAFQGEIGQMLFETLEQDNMHGLAFWGNGFKQMSTNVKPLIRPEDFSGQRFRIQPSKVIDSQFKRMKASTATIPFNEVYRNLENGFVDGQENTISNFNTKRLYQVQKYVTISNHGYLGYAVIMNKEYWEKLPLDIQEQLMQAMNETTKWANEVSLTMNDVKLLKEMKNIEVYELSPDEQAVWKKTLDKVYDQHSQMIGLDLMNQLIKLREHR